MKKKGLKELDKAREETISSFVDFLSTKGEYISANDVDEFLVSKLKQ